MSAIMFLCDIMGTYYESKEEAKLRQSKVKKMILNLKLLKEENNADVILFSFVSTGDINFVKEYLDEFNKYKSKDIITTINFYDKGYIINNKSFKNKDENNIKAFTIFDYAKKIQQTFNIKSLYYADDSDFNHELFFLYKQKYSDLNFDVYNLAIKSRLKKDSENLVTSDKEGIDGLIECIEKVKTKRTNPKGFHLD